MKKLMAAAIVVLVALNVILMSMLSYDTEGTIQNEVIINQVEVSGYSTDVTNIIEETQEKLVIVQQEAVLNSGLIYQADDEETIIVSVLNNLDLTQQPISVVFNNDQVVSASILGVDEQSNILVLSVKPSFKVSSFNLSNSDLLQQGELIVSLGAQIRLGQSGYVSIGYLESTTLYDELTYAMRADVLVNSQNIGGPIINMAGDLIGICNAYSVSTLTSPTFLPINSLDFIVQGFLEGTPVSYQELGIEIIDISLLTSYQKASLSIDLTRNFGIYISDVEEMSIADEIGLKPGMIIDFINDVAISNIQEYHQQVHQELDSWIFKGDFLDGSFEIEWQKND
ncbi:MAG: trypsin-like peptidase domain-containing protein [Erysipelotrichaceae bacterium]